MLSMGWFQEKSMIKISRIACFIIELKLISINLFQQYVLFISEMSLFKSFNVFHYTYFIM